MSGNNRFTTGNYSYASKDKQMAAYDSLPKSVREALANAAFAWAPYPIAQRFKKSQRHDAAKRLVADIARWDADQIARDRTRVWGWPKQTRGKNAAMEC